jgi:hypothetical protein
MALTNNQFTGEIPYDVTNLTKLMFIDLESNNFNITPSVELCDGLQHDTLGTGLNNTELKMNDNNLCPPYDEAYCLYGNTTISTQDISECAPS